MLLHQAIGGFERWFGVASARDGGLAPAPGRLISCGHDLGSPRPDAQQEHRLAARFEKFAPGCLVTGCLFLGGTTNGQGLTRRAFGGRRIVAALRHLDERCPAAAAGANLPASAAQIEKVDGSLLTLKDRAGRRAEAQTRRQRARHRHDQGLAR